MMEGVFDKRRLLDLIRYFIVFEDLGGGALSKKMAGYHQFHAVNTAVDATLRASGSSTAAMRLQGEQGVKSETDVLGWSGTHKARAKASPWSSTQGK